MGLDALALHRLSGALGRRGLARLARWAGALSGALHRGHLSPEAELGPGCQLGYGGQGVVVEPGARVGRRCFLAHDVTLARDGGAGAGAAPVLGDYVYVGAGARVVGGVRVGDFAVIGANAVVLSDVACGAVVAGVPARELRREQDPVAAYERDTGERVDAATRARHAPRPRKARAG